MESSPLFWYPGHELILRDIVRAEGSHLFDSRGRRYVDLESGVWCTPLGHGHPAVLRALSEQAARVGHAGFNYSSPVVADAARDILSLVGFDGGRCVFLCSGSEAVEYGVRAARSLIDRRLMMTMTDSYFGAYGSARERRDEEWFCFDWSACVRAGCGEGCEHWAAIPFDRVGAFLFEPGSSSGLVRFPPEGLIRRITRAVRDAGGLVIVNEVTTGVGRTGEWFGFQHYGISPDIVALGKGIGNGYPVSVTAFAPRVVERLGAQPIAYAQSHQNDPAGAAVVRAVVRVIRDEGLVKRGREIGGALAAGLEGIGERTGRIAEVRARGLMAAVELKDDADAAFTVATHRELLRRGFIVGRRPGVSVLRIDPALTIDPADIDDFLAAIESILA